MDLGALGRASFLCRLVSPTRFKSYIYILRLFKLTIYTHNHTQTHTKQQQLEDEATPYDAIIIGSGLAGISLLAEAVAQGYKRVMILEQKVRHTSYACTCKLRLKKKCEGEREGKEKLGNREDTLLVLGSPSTKTPQPAPQR